MKRLATLLLSFLLLPLSVTTVDAQTAEELNKRYETEGGKYVVRPGVLMMAKFADEICEANIKPRTTLGVEAREQGMMESGDGTWVMPWILVDAVMKEVAQVSGHSSHRPMLTLSGGCTSVRLDAYGEVHVYTTVTCVPGGSSGVTELKVFWMKRGCGSSGLWQSNNGVQRMLK